MPSLVFMCLTTENITRINGATACEQSSTSFLMLSLETWDATVVWTLEPPKRKWDIFGAFDAIKIHI